MPRAAKPYKVLNINMGDRVYACLDTLTRISSQTKTEIVERLVNQEYRKWFGVLERHCELTGEDISDYPFPLSGPTPEEEARQIREQEEILEREIARVIRRIEEHMKRETVNAGVTREITIEEWKDLLIKAEKHFGKEAFSTITLEQIATLLEE